MPTGNVRPVEPPLPVLLDPLPAPLVARALLKGEDSNEYSAREPGQRGKRERTYPVGFDLTCKTVAGWCPIDGRVCIVAVLVSFGLIVIVISRGREGVSWSFGGWIASCPAGASVGSSVYILNLDLDV